MIPNYWKALIKKGVITEKDYFEKVEPCNVLIKRAKDRLISEFLNDILGFNYNKSTQFYENWVRELREKWIKRSE